jgi:predicted amidohydrolase YtcJ
VQRASFSALLLGIALFQVPGGELAGAEADLILHGGKVVAVDEKFSIGEAVAVAGGKVLRVGSDADVLRHRGSRTEMVDLKGRVVIPGLIDSHTHPLGASATEFDHPIPAMESVADVLAYFKERAQVVPEGEWIVLQQVFITRLREQRYPTRAELDSVAPRHPVLFRTGPDASLNSLALHLSGIDRNFQVSDGGSGFAEKDPQSGEPTGILRNCSRYVKVKSSTKTPTPAEQEARLVQLFADYNSVGITSVCDRDASLDGIERYRSLRERSALTVRVSCSQGIGSIGDLAKITERIRSIARSPLHTERDDWLRLIGIKTYLDGGMLTGSAYMREPWGVSAIYGITDPAYRGVLFIPRERLLAMVRTAVESGLQFTAHSQGDGAVHELLGVYDELAREGLPVRETRCSLTHASFMSREAVEQAARLGVMIDLQPAWLYLDAATLVKHFGHDRLRWFQPLQTLFESGAIAGGGSDHMQKIGSLRSINPYNPFLGMATAITRRARWHDGQLYPEEGLSREQALRFYTINNARLLFREERTGSLEPGKLADMAVLDTDLLSCPEEQIAATRVLRTYVGGRLVFASE